MRKIFSGSLLIGIFIVMLTIMAFVPFSQVESSLDTATATPTATATEVVSVPLPDGMEFWCLPEGISYPKDPANIVKTDDAIDALYDGTNLSIKGPLSGCFVTMPDEGQNADNMVAIYDNSNSAAWYTRKFYKSQDGLVSILKHSYIINPPYWKINYRMEVLDENGKVLFDAPLVYSRNWAPDVCWNGKMPNPKTYLCELQQDQHPWDAWYGKPMPTGVPQD
jgi:hypothetical protein